MKVNPNIETAAHLLEEAGYRKLPVPLFIAGLQFDISAAMVGTGRTPDLILLGDTSARSEDRLLQVATAIARALDVLGSKRPLTLAIAGPRPAEATLRAITSVCRVLLLEAETPVDRERTVQVALAVLLPLNLSSPGQAAADPMLELREELRSIELTEFDMLEEAAFGPDSVRARFHLTLSELLGPFVRDDA